MKKLRLIAWLLLGLSLTFLWACTTSLYSFESADIHLREHLLPKIKLESQLVTDTAAYNVVIPPLTDSVADPNTFPLYGAKPSNDPNIVYLEIYSSAEKANGERQDERWLVDVAEKYNQLLKTLGLSWLAFLVTGILLSRFVGMPAITVLIDRSYCPTTEWQQVVQTYSQLYQQHQQRRLQLESVILFSSLGEEHLLIPPEPQILAQSSPQRQLELRASYPQAQLLECTQ